MDLHRFNRKQLIQAIHKMAQDAELRTKAHQKAMRGQQLIFSAVLDKLGGEATVTPQDMDALTGSRVETKPQEDGSLQINLIWPTEADAS